MTPPVEIIGSAIAAAGWPALWLSISSKPTSRQVQSQASVRRRNREVAGQTGSVAAPADRIRRGPCAARQAMEGRAEADHLVAAGRELGHAQRDLVGLAAGVEQHDFLQPRRQQCRQLAAQLHDLRGQQPAEQVDRPLKAAPDRGDHGRVIVAERRAHLAGGEVEDPPAAVIVDVGPLGALDEERREVADIADHVALDRFLQLAPPRLPAAGVAVPVVARHRLRSPGPR
jgi:hypothetical protein